MLLDVPDLHVDEIHLEVDDLRARVSLNAEVLDVLKINVGADVALDRVQLDLQGVEAAARLTVRLRRVAEMVERVLTSIDRNPALLEHVARSVGSAAGEVGSAAGELGSTAGRAVGELGRSTDDAIEGVTRTASESGDAVVRRATGDGGRKEGRRRPPRRVRRSRDA